MLGTLGVTQKETKVEWKINDFLRVVDFVNVPSPEFQFSDVTWKMFISLYDFKLFSSVGGVSLCLRQISSSKDFTVNVTLSLKTVNNGENDLETTCTGFMNKEDNKFYKHDFISKSDLIRKKSELLPSGTLTVICTLKRYEQSVVSECLDASTRTEKKTGVLKLQKHLHEISLSGDISDVILKVGDQEFKSHRCILAARSPVFLAMMKNKMKENATGVVDIEDVNPKTFSDFLNYLYTGSTENLMTENVAELYTVADRYQVEDLKKNCLDHMLVNVSVENFCDVFMLSIQHTEEKLKEICIEYFGKHLLDIIETCKWQSFLCENPILCNELHIEHIKLNKNICSLHCKGNQK